MQRKHYEKEVKPQDASKLRVGIAVSDFNSDITGAMLEGALATLKAWGVAECNIRVAHTYGSFELPFACARLAKKHRLDAVVAVGCIIKGETRHDEYLAQAAAQGLTTVSLAMGIPVGFGVITTNDLAQAKRRSPGKAVARSEATVVALQAALL